MKTVALTGLLALPDAVAAGLGFTQITNRTIANSAAATSLVGAGQGSLTIPANTAWAGMALRLRMAGVFSCALVPGNATFRVMLGATTLATGTVSSLLSLASGAGFNVALDLVFRSIGAAGTVVLQGSATFANGVLSRGTVDLNTGTGTATIDTTTAQALDITFQWSTASASNTITSVVTTLG